MVFLSGSFLGSSIFYSPNLIPGQSPYNKLTLYGEGIFDNIWIRNRIESDNYINNLTIDNYNPMWDNDTVFWGDFEEENLNTGNVKYLTSPITKFIVNKRDVRKNIYTNIGEITNTDADSYSVNDYKVANGEWYEYQILPKSDTELAEPLVSEQIQSDYYGWFLIDEDENVVYKFDLNLQPSGFTINQGLTQIETMNRFNTFIQDNKNFKSGSISAILSEELTETTLKQTPSFLDEFQDFIGNGRSKILKSRKGDMLKVMTSGFQRSLLSNSIDDQIEVISFNFTECEEI